MRLIRGAAHLNRWARSPWFCRIRKRLRIIFSFGRYYLCVCCGARLKKFDGPKCPDCGSVMRHRAVWKYLQSHPGLLQGKMKLLHVAPETCLKRCLQALPNIDYYDVDLRPDFASHTMDITAMPYPDDMFDAVICIHVLEHIPDDRRAMRELCRVLKPGGWGILQSPLAYQQSSTFEDVTVHSPEKREELFGHPDHMRVYGLDYKHRLEAAGFEVCVDDSVAALPEDKIERLGLRREKIYMVFKTRFRETVKNIPKHDP